MMLRIANQILPIRVCGWKRVVDLHIRGRNSAMSYILSIVLFLAICVLLFMPYVVPKRRNLHGLHAIVDLLVPPRASLDNLLRARAFPNARLAQAFSIDNTFVSPSCTVHDDFLRKAKDLMDNAAPGGDWRKFQDVVIIVVDLWPPREANQTVPFATFVQCITFSVVLIALFDVDPYAMDPTDVIHVTVGINELWRLSKTSSSMQPDLLQIINEKLSLWISHSIQNPLNLLIPSYETMWRVVAVVLANIYNDQLYRQRFESFLAEPTLSRFQAAPDGSVSVDCIIKEAMRLHPPTKRLSRLPLDVPVLPLGGRLGRYTRALAGIWVQAADIEALHRSHDIWGPAPEQFDPTRHLPARLTATQKKAHLPFGYGPLRCVAHKWAPRAVGLIVAGIVANEERTITPGEKVGGREGWDGWFVTRTKARG